LEFHRLNSPYIMTGINDAGAAFADVLKPELGMATVAAKKVKKGKSDETATDETAGKEPDDVAGVVNLRRLAKVCFKYDPNSLVHGVFLEKIAGRLRHPRALSSFIEAAHVGRADSGGVKFDRALPKPSVANVDAKGGYGNVPFHRTEYVAKSIVAYFTIDLAQIRGYGLGDEAARLLITLSLWKVRAFLDSTMRLRSACELELAEGNGKLSARRPDAFELPSLEELSGEVRSAIAACQSAFANPPITVLTWNNPKG
jgi:CRISPR-associated protein Csb1